ncbi:MAG TPA: hypothetical protein PLP95_03760 [Microthrixaceae bacterium]|nr:hypothetical protein [Microthrixaceae bacterium]
MRITASSNALDSETRFSERAAWNTPAARSAFHDTFTAATARPLPHPYQHPEGHPMYPTSNPHLATTTSTTSTAGAAKRRHDAQLRST